MSAETPLKAFVEYPGDPSVGIFSARFEVELPISTSELRQEDEPGWLLNQLRETIEGLYSMVMDEPMGVTFNAECPTCSNLWGEHSIDCPEISRGEEQNE